MFSWHETLQQSLFAKGRINTFERDRSLRDEKRRLDGMDYQTLVNEYTQRKGVRAAKAMDPKEFRASVAAARNQPTQEQQQVAPQSGYSEYEPMPLEWTPRGSLTPLTLDRKMLIHIANTDSTGLFRSLVRRFGAEAVNARLAGRG